MTNYQRACDTLRSLKRRICGIIHILLMSQYLYISKNIWQIGGFKGTLLSAQNKGKRNQAYPDQNNIYYIIHKIRISHESHATDKH